MQLHHAASAYVMAVIAGTTACAGTVEPDLHSSDVASASSALTTPGLFFQGNNFSGAERGFGSAIEEKWGPAIPGVEGTTYWWPTPADDALPIGMNLVRLPFQWERLQPSLNADFDATYLAKLHATAEAWRAVGVSVVLDVHNYAYYKASGRGSIEPGQHIGSPEVPVAAFVDFWRRMAAEFGSASRSSPFIFGLMNEPHDIAVSVWVDAAQQALTAIRAQGANNPVFVPGADWTTAGDFAWSANARLLQSVTDPADNFAIEVHQYHNGDCVPSSFLDKLEPFEAWAVANNRVAFLGETDLTIEASGSSTEACQEAFKNLIHHLHARAAGTSGGVWIGYSYWEGEGLSQALPHIQPHLPATCANGARDGNETDIDCGATCRRCPSSRTCAKDYDCQSGFCTNGTCTDAGVPGGGAGAGGAASATGGTASMAGTAGSAAGTAGRAGAGAATSGAAGQGGTTSGGANASSGNGSSAVAGAAPEGGSTESDGCGCRVTRRAPGPAWAAVLAALVSLSARRRRATRDGAR